MSELLLQSAHEVFATSKPGWFLIYRENAIGSDRGTFAGMLELTRGTEGQAIVNGTPPALDDFADADLLGPHTGTGIRRALEQQAMQRRQATAVFHELFQRSPNLQRARREREELDRKHAERDRALVFKVLQSGAMDRASLAKIVQTKHLDKLVDEDRVACSYMPGLKLYALPEGS